MEQTVVRLKKPHKGYDGVIVGVQGKSASYLFGKFVDDCLAIDPTTLHEIPDITRAFYAPPEVIQKLKKPKKSPTVGELLGLPKQEHAEEEVEIKKVIKKRHFGIRRFGE